MNRVLRWKSTTFKLFLFKPLCSGLFSVLKQLNSFLKLRIQVAIWTVICCNSFGNRWHRASNHCSWLRFICEDDNFSLPPFIRSVEPNSLRNFSGDHIMFSINKTHGNCEIKNIENGFYCSASLNTDWIFISTSMKSIITFLFISLTPANSFWSKLPNKWW